MFTGTSTFRMSMPNRGSENVRMYVLTASGFAFAKSKPFSSTPLL